MEQSTQKIKLNYDLGKWFTDAWSLLRAHMWQLILLNLVVIVPSMAFGGAYGVYVSRQIHGQSQMDYHRLFALVATRGDIIRYLSIMLVSVAIAVPMTVGVSAVVLHLVRTNKFDWSRVWTGFKKWSSCFAVGLVFGLVNGVSTVFPILNALFPIWLAVMVCNMFANYALTESGADYRFAMREALRIVKGNFWWAVLFGVLGWVLPLSGIILCCVGFFFSIAYYGVLTAIAYNDLSGQLAAKADSERSTSGTV